MTVEQVREELERVYEQVKNAVGWQVDKRIILSVASYYVTSSNSFNGKRFLAVSDEIKKQAGWTSPLRSHTHYMMVALLDSSDELPSKAVEQLLLKEQTLKDAKFKRSAYSYLASLFLSDNKEEADSAAQNGKQLYDEIRQHHRFLTSNEDVPYAVLLGQLDGNLLERARTMNEYYKELKTKGFRMGNDLQWMSQIMTLKSEKYDSNMVSRALMIKNQLEDAGIKIKASHYVSIGFLAVMGITDNDIAHVIETYRELVDMKLFRWYKEMVFPIAVLLETKHLVEVQAQATISFTTSIEMILQAQQAAAIASMAAISASVAASSSSS